MKIVLLIGLHLVRTLWFTVWLVALFAATLLAAAWVEREWGINPPFVIVRFRNPCQEYLPIYLLCMLVLINFSCVWNRLTKRIRSL